MTEHVGGTPGRVAIGPAGNSDLAYEHPNWAAQVILAAMMRSPEKPLMSLIQEHYPNRNSRFYGDVIVTARTAIGELIDGLHKFTETEPAPILLDRLSFTWKVLRQADVLLRKPKKSEMPLNTGISNVEVALSSILPRPFTKLEPPLRDALVEWLRLGNDGRYLYHYWCFRRATSPILLPSPFCNLSQTRDDALLRTVIWWCLRARKEEFVEVAENDIVRLEYEFVFEEVLRDLKMWCGAKIEQYPDIAGQIELELDTWFRYSRLDLSADASNTEDATPDPEFARAFIKHNGLDVKLRIHRSASGGVSEQRVRQLEATIQQYADEIQTLENRVQLLQAAQQAPTVEPPHPEPDFAGFTELREVLKTIDSKYALDTLNAIQLGEETHLTFRSFAAHLFYAFRKRGLTEYPKDDIFDLSYEASGLYECEGFEVPPGSSLPVKVARRGWALKARGRWLPVRRARVVRVNEV